MLALGETEQVYPLLRGPTDPAPSAPARADNPPRALRPRRRTPAVNPYYQRQLDEAHANVRRVNALRARSGLPPLARTLKPLRWPPCRILSLFPPRTLPLLLLVVGADAPGAGAVPAVGASAAAGAASPAVPAPAASAPTAAEGAVSACCRATIASSRLRRRCPGSRSAAVDLRFEDTPVREVVHAILGDLLRLDYMLHPPVEAA
ncbi:hypothetical protein MASR1M6_27070 [Rubrivivax sp.]